MAHALAQALGTGRIEVILLNHAPVELAFAVIARGKLLYQRSLAEKEEYEANVMSRYYDFEAWLRQE